MFAFGLVKDTAALQVKLGETTWLYGDFIDEQLRLLRRQGLSSKSQEPTYKREPGPRKTRGTVIHLKTV
jgi:hypothetical protein